MYRKALVGGKFLYFVHAPPLTELDKKPEKKRPKSPDPNEPPLYASVYYYWWAYLRLNGDYIACCERGGKGEMAAVYKYFGDIRDGRRRSTDPSKPSGPVNEFREWWIERGAKLFAEPQTKENIRIVTGVPTKKDTNGRVLLSVPLAGNVDVTIHALGGMIRRMLPEFQKKHGHYSNAKWKPEDKYRLSVLFETLKIARAEAMLRTSGKKYTQLNVMDKTDIEVKIKDEYDDPIAIKSRIVSRALDRANRLIANVGEGRFPDFSEPREGSFTFYKKRPRSPQKKK